MRVELSVRDLVLASWPVAGDEVARVLPANLEPLPVDDRHLVTLAGFRVLGGRAGRLPVPPFSQLNVRVYTDWAGEPAVYFLLSAVTLAGLTGLALGATYRAARIRVRPGLLEAPGLGVALPYVPVGSGEPGLLGRHELGLFSVSGGIRAFRIRRGAVEWRRAEAADGVRADVLVARGFEPHGPPGVLYAERASFSAELPRRIVSTRSSGSSA